jgi:hypothetical protein
MNSKIWLAVGAGVFILLAAYMFGPEAARDLFDSLVGAVGEAS